jgi:hypothetical protein
MTTLAYNLKRVLNLVSFEKLMAAVGWKAGWRRLPAKKELVSTYNLDTAQEHPRLRFRSPCK